MSFTRWTPALLLVLAASARAQRMQLELRPRAGDTLRMRLDQVTEMSGERKGSPTQQMITTLRMFSRAIVESTTPDAAIILAITDSVVVSPSDERARLLAEQTARQLRGRQMRLRLAPDGTVGVAGKTADVTREVTDLVSVMPASFPSDPISVGEVWVREMPIPPATRLSFPTGGFVRASFRFDSVARGGDVAYVSMRGTLQRQSTPTTVDQQLSGTVNGSMVIDRRRGWLSESRFLVQMRTTYVPRAGANATPMQVRMKITQHMRVAEKGSKSPR